MPQDDGLACDHEIQLVRKPQLGDEDSVYLIAAIVKLCGSDTQPAAKYILDAAEAGIIGSVMRVPQAPRAVTHALQWTATQAYAYVRFTIPQLEYIAERLGLPETISTSTSGKVGRTEALAIVCRRLAEPSRWYVVAAEFWRSRSSLSRIFWATVSHIARMHHKRLRFHLALVRARIHKYCDAIETHGSPVKGCFASIDGTKNCIARPTPGVQGGPYWLLMAFALRFTAPAEGAKHDSTVLKHSGIVDIMAANSCFSGKVIYGDGGYAVSDYICAPYHGANPTVYQSALNTLMSTKRLTVEWLFKDLKTQWSHINWHIKMQARSTRVGLKFQTAMLLTNIHTCIYGSQTSRYFNCRPPSIDDYLSN